MKREVFYTEMRRRDSGLFGTSLTRGQVKGCEAILDECIARGADLGQAAYILSTAYGESGRKMQPVRENMKYSAKRIPQVFGARRRQGVAISKLAGNPRLLANTVYGGDWGSDNLGNRIGTEDGWNMRGGGIGQITGYRNFKKWSDGLGIDLIGDPDLIGDLGVSVKSIVQPMLEGWATGKPLHRYVSGDKRDYIHARQVWNGLFAADEYAKNAKAFEKALIKADYSARLKLTADDRIDTPVAKIGFGAIILAFFAAIFRKAER